jgi:hypothetical protein
MARKPLIINAVQIETAEVESDTVAVWQREARVGRHPVTPAPLGHLQTNDESGMESAHEFGSESILAQWKALL